MKKALNLLVIIFAIMQISCDSITEEIEEDVDVNSFSIIPGTTNGRTNNYLGCVEISSRITNIKVWDHGQIDGDIVSIYANGNTIINQKELSGPSNPISVDYDFGFNGYNYITLFAHNLGTIAPNTCTVAINGQEFVLEANLDANGSVDVVVSGFDIECGNNNNNNNGGNNGNNGTTTGDIIFWVNKDFGCGSITVNVDNVGSSTISTYYNSSPTCANSSNGNFQNLSPGTYNYTASCSNLNWSGSFTISANTCFKLQLSN